jgi:hypothetical protein
MRFWDRGIETVRIKAFRSAFGMIGHRVHVEEVWLSGVTPTLRQSGSTRLNNPAKQDEYRDCDRTQNDGPRANALQGGIGLDRICS